MSFTIDLTYITNMEEAMRTTQETFHDHIAFERII